MRLIKEGKPINYKIINGQNIPVIQPEVYHVSIVKIVIMR